MRPPAYNGDDVQQISPEQGERNVAMAVCVQLAGRAIIRVVSRCEEAQDNCNLGRCIKQVYVTGGSILCYGNGSCINSNKSEMLTPGSSIDNWLDKHCVAQLSHPVFVP
ncbi:hypothetical protein K0M31_012070 [Melipona bicolor]|uniref:Uncharacterized protein n=1 Tax=Melipona bicolor TaxID=60889 RepID=A0AA40GAT2_9HYME|nr:hypothetical protein K0M31_012070 [Melipona bicolor]